VQSWVFSLNLVQARLRVACPAAPRVRGNATDKAEQLSDSETMSLLKVAPPARPQRCAAALAHALPRADSARAAGPEPPAEGTPSVAALRAP